MFKANCAFFLEIRPEDQYILILLWRQMALLRNSVPPPKFRQRSRACRLFIALRASVRPQLDFVKKLLRGIRYLALMLIIFAPGFLLPIYLHKI